MTPESTAGTRLRALRLLAMVALAAVGHAGLAKPAAAQGDSWSPLAPLPTPRRLLAAAAEGGAIYTFGGCGSPCFDPPVHTSTLEETLVEVFEGGQWTPRKPIPAILFGAAAAAPGNGKIYVVGGFVTGSSTLEYGPKPPDTWSRKAPMPTPRHGLAVVALKGKVYAVGGSDGTSPTGALEVYDPALNSWSQKTPMPTPRVFLAAAAVKGKLYAIGGAPDCCGNGVTDAVEVYDPKTDRWSRAAPLPVALQVSAAVAIAGRIYVFGGFIPGQGVQGSTFEYDPDGGTWRFLKPMLEPRDQAPAVVVDDVAHVIGGSVNCHCQARATHDRYEPPKQELNLLINKINSPQGSVCAGETITYTIIVTNQGKATVSDAIVTDDLQSTRLLDVKWCRGAGCTPDMPGNLSDLVTLAPGNFVKYRASGTVAATAQKIISNTAKVQPPLPATEIRSKEVTNPIVPCELSITKTDGRSKAAPGDQLRYQITVRNSSPIAISGRVTDDIVATGLQGVRWCRGTSCSSDNLDQTISVPANGTVVYEVTGTVPCVCGKTRIENTACVAAPGRPATCATDTDPLAPAPGGDLALSVAGPGNVASCGGTPYTFTVTNRGPGVACGAVLQIQPPVGSAVVSISDSCAGPSCALGDLAPGARAQVTASFTVPAGLQCPAVLLTAASASACGSTTSASFPTQVPCDLAITKTDGLATAAPGDPILYTIAVTNQGCAAAFGASLFDAFPTDLLGVRWCRGAGCAPVTFGDLAATVDLPVGGAETFRAAGTVSPMFTGTLRNTAALSPPDGPALTARDDTEILALPGLTALCKSISGTPFEAGTITKTFVIWNGGPFFQADNPGPEFVDPLPAGLTLISASASSGTITTAANTVSWNGSIPVGGMVTVQIEALIGAGTVGTTICNGGTTQFDSDGDGTNEASRATPAPCCFVVVKTFLVPALSDLGLATLALLLSLVALLRLRRRGVRG